VAIAKLKSQPALHGTAVSPGHFKGSNIKIKNRCFEPFLNVVVNSLLDNHLSNTVQVTVCSELDLEQSNPMEGLFIHVYTIHIENKGKDAVQLIRRKWYIQDQYGAEKIVEGEGVVGEKPILEPGHCFNYTSYCVLQCNFGSMRGYYTFEKTGDKTQFLVDIPKFELENRWILN
jgi:ApaG protein